MIQAYKNKIRYWVAVKFGSLETAYQDNVCEVICPNCEMKTSINVERRSEQPCYFCGDDLLTQHPQKTPTIETHTTVSASEETTTAQTQENTENLATAQ